MKQLIQAFIALCIALLVLLVVRAFAFTVYEVPTNINLVLKKGDRVMVNKLSHSDCRRGELVVFRDSGNMIGCVLAVPGDTVRVGRERFVIPMQCCKRCTSPDCKLYMMDIGAGRTLVYKHQMIGKAYRLFHLPF